MKKVHKENVNTAPLKSMQLLSPPALACVSAGTLSGAPLTDISPAVPRPVKPVRYFTLALGEDGGSLPDPVLR
ncbi:hypothetical protein [Salinimonas sediminis]|uniref:Uncharacterized protein n=1 Tax=Salinimonas sediminis TaxID=2303538 RepID=A0A346NQX6_9ALTE|nr:hypothetical protein [Salinimonas sediminis]AXR07933.1 hypothetical protein D0Y50_17170 [Salinimonas sediminis]